LEGFDTCLVLLLVLLAGFLEGVDFLGAFLAGAFLGVTFLLFLFLLFS
jgi:hypothetical protein